MKKDIVCFILLLLSAYAGAYRYSVSELDAEEYDTKFSKYIREILENFRNLMGDGIPDIGIPAVDPLSIALVDEDIETGFVNMLFQLRDLNVTGLSKFDLKELKADLQKGFMNISIALPDLRIESQCLMDGKILCVLPINSKGPFYVKVSQVSIDGYGLLNVTVGNKTRVHMNDLRLSLDFRSLDIKFDGLLGGAHWAQVLLDISTIVAPSIFSYFNEPIMNEINRALLTLANSELDKGALNDFLDFIPLIS